MSGSETPIEETKVQTPKLELPSAAETELGRGWLPTGPRSFTLSEGNLFLVLAVIIGLFSGMAVVCFRITIEWVRLSLLGSALSPSPLRVLFVPALAGLVVAFLVQRFF